MMNQDHNEHESDIQENEGVEQSTQPMPEDQEDYKQKWLRAQADYQNLLKEIATQKSDWAKMSELHILEEFIPVYENFKKAFAHSVEGESSQWENWKKGIEYIMKQFGDILRSHGIEEIKTVGELFDPTLHEALSEEVSDEHKEHTILREVSGGYKMGTKVIQVAKVVVATKAN